MRAEGEQGRKGNIQFKAYRAGHSIAANTAGPSATSEAAQSPFTISSVQSSPVAQSCPTLCDLVDCSTPGLPVHHQLPEFTQTRVHRAGDAIQPSHPLSSPSPPAFNLSQSFPMSQFFASGGQSIGVSASASVLPMNIQN